MMLQRLGQAAVGEGGVDRQQIHRLRPRLLDFGLDSNAVGRQRVGPRQGVGIGPGLADLERDVVGPVGHVDARIVRGVRLGHLLRAVAQAHDARRRAVDQGLDDGKDLGAEIVVELLRDVARQLQMLLLVVAHGHVGCLVEENVGRHQIGIDVEPDRGVLAVLARLFLELGHAVEPAQARHAVEDPGQLRMGRNLALVENDGTLGIDARGQERRRHLARLRLQLLGILPRGDGVQIDDAVDALIVGLQADEVADGAEIVSEMEIARRLNAGKDAAHVSNPGCGPPSLLIAYRFGPRQGRARHYGHRQCGVNPQSLIAPACA